jgi:thymidylate kinase
MIVYIEGVDGSGKSTFAKAITEYLQENKIKVYPKAEKLMVTHPWRIDRITKERLIKELVRCLSSSTVYIVDRGELSDIIYRTFDKDKYDALMTLAEFHTFYGNYADRYVVVHCDTDLSEQLMLSRGEDNLISIQEHQKLRYLFQQIMPLFNARKFDAKINIEHPTYLSNVCADIRITLRLRGAAVDE